MESENNKNDWYLGLDLGVASVGWCITDDQYSIPKLKGKRAWGVRLFGEAKTNEDRRLIRTARRNNLRRQKRVEYLKCIFKSYIDEVDKNFFDRLKESKFETGDKSFETGDKFNSKNTLFNDNDYTDKEYHKDFKTIWHLRKYLIDASNINNSTQTNDSTKNDIAKKIDQRHFYLAISHILKHRGHFLSPNLTNISQGFDELIEKFYKEAENYEFKFDKEKSEEDIKKAIKNALSSTDEDGADADETDSDKTNEDKADSGKKKKKSITEKKKELKALISTDTSTGSENKQSAKQLETLLYLICGSNVDIKKIFYSEQDDSEQDDEYKLELGKDDYDEKRPEILEQIGEDNINIIDIAKQLYDCAYIYNVMKGNDYISEAYIDEFDHQTGFWDNEELKGFKEVNDKGGKPKKDKNGKIKKWFDSRKLKGSFGVSIPKQLHEQELKKILDNADFLKDDEKEKIKKIFSVKIPYYCGPLTTKTNKTGERYSENSWLVKNAGKEECKIRPWNFEEIVDKTKTAERFIKRMVRKCTYLYSENVLPKNSIYYKRYMVLNTINNMKINNKRIEDIKLKQKIYNELFLKEEIVNKTKIKKFLKCQMDDFKTVSIVSNTNDDEEEQNIPNLNSEIKFTKIFKDKKDKFDENIEKIEEAIKAITVLPDDREMLEKKIKKIFDNTLTKEQINEISKYNYEGWGKFSKKLLTCIKAEIDNKRISILDELENTNYNFMELLYDKKYKYENLIDEFNAINSGEKPWRELLETSYASNPVKRAVIQTVKIIDELIAVKNEQLLENNNLTKNNIGLNELIKNEKYNEQQEKLELPKKIFIEFARENQTAEKRKKTSSRFKTLNTIYKKIKKENEEVFKELQKHEDNKQALSSQKLFLYFTQLGKCMYCNMPLDIDNLEGADYDIDHIVPQARIKDDSPDNLALVHSKENKEKTDNYPIPEGFRKYKLFKMLLKAKLISNKKYYALIKTELTEKDIIKFTNRQLVETSQIMKMVKDIIDHKYKNHKHKEMLNIITHKANITSDARNIRFLYLVKFRDLNDLHHAKDAFLTIVFGNVFQNRIRSFQEDKVKKMFNIEKVLGYYEKNGDKKELTIEEIETSDGKPIWNEKIAKNIKETYWKNDILVTRKTEIRNGAFYGEQLTESGKKSGGNSKNYSPAKTNDTRLTDTEKMGGYKGIAGSYCVFIKTIDKNNKEEYKFTFIPVLYNKNPNEYLETIYGNSFEIIYDKIPFGSLLKICDDTKSGDTKKENIKYPIYVTGFSKGTVLAIQGRQLLLKKDEIKYLKKIDKFNTKIEKANEEKTNQEIETELEHSNGIYKKKDELQITKENNWEIFKSLVNKLTTAYKHNPFAKTPIEFLLKKENLEEEFKNISIVEQIKQILNFLPFFNSQSSINLKLLGGVKNAGNTITQEYFNNDPILVKQSITGLFEKEIHLIGENNLQLK